MPRISDVTDVRLRRRHKVIKSDQRLVSWARKQKKKTLAPPPTLPLRVPLVCPLVGCTGVGHVNGIDLSHITLSGCPVYHNLPFEKWTEMRVREEGIVSPARPQKLRTNSPCASPNKLAKSLAPTDRSYQLRTIRKEPSFDNLATAMEIYQFRCAQQRVIVDKEQEAKKHLTMCARVALQKLHESDELALDEPYGALHSTKRHELTEHTGTALEQRIRTVILGNWHIEPLYASVYPAYLACLPTIYVCEYCLTPMRCSVAYERHNETCTWSFPPGDEIYRKDELSFFEVDGGKQPDYCRNLCLLTKLFLKHKTVYETDRVSAFLFYILTEMDSDGCHIVGYFSKQKPDDTHDTCSNSVSYNNLSCILTLPQYQCKGYGRMLIELSYILSLMENRIGSPERPLSDLGLILYRKYWKWEILNYLSTHTTKTVDIRAFSQELGIAIPDIVSTLLDMKMLVCFRAHYYIINNKADVEDLLRAMNIPPASRRIDKSCLHWEPHSVAPSSKIARAKSFSKLKSDESSGAVTSG